MFYKFHARIVGIGKVNNIKAGLLTVVSTGINVPLQFPPLRRLALMSDCPVGTVFLSTTPALMATMTECFSTTSSRGTNYFRRSLQHLGDLFHVSAVM